MIYYTDEFIHKARSNMKDKDSIHSWVLSIATLVGGFEGKRVLEVGCDDKGGLINEISSNFGPLETVGMNLVVRDRKLSSNCRLEKGDIRSTSYDNCYFDVIVSSSAFEHIANFHIAIAEMYRILEPGGYLFSHFGPIWSTSYGHHLWIFHEGNVYNYWNMILPPFCHLLMNHQTLLEMLVKNEFDYALSNKIVEYVYFSNEQNRLFFEDYEYLIRSYSKFNIIFLKGYDNQDLKEIYERSITPYILEELHAKYPSSNGFMYNGISMLLRKE